MGHPAAPAVFAALAIALAACTGTTGADAPLEEGPPPTSAVAATPGAPVPSDEDDGPLSMEAQAEDAFLRALTGYHDLVRDPDPDDPRVAEGFDGPSLRRIREILAMMAATGQRSDGSVRAEVTVIGSTRVPSTERDDGADVVEVTGCLVDGAVIVDREGRTIDDDATSDRIVARVRRGPDGWRVVEQRTIAEWDDLSGCDR